MINMIVDITMILVFILMCIIKINCVYNMIMLND